MKGSRCNVTSNGLKIGRNVSICVILLGLAATGALFCRQKFLRDRPKPTPPAADVAKEKSDAVATNRVDRLVGTAEDEAAVPSPRPTEGLKFSEDGKTLVFVPKDLTSVTIPDGVTAIADRAFENHKALERVAIPPSVIRFGRDAFKGCDKLTGVFISDLAAWCGIPFLMDCNWDNPLGYAHNLYLNGSLVSNMEIPKNVSSIGKHTFRGCTSLTRVLIPGNVIYIDADAFADCGGLKEFAVAEDSDHYKSVDGLLLTKDGRILVAAPGGLENVKIPDGVVTIGDYAFLGCRRLSKVSIPDGVTSIGERSFACCSGLESIEIPSSVMKIGISAFQDCTGLADVHITDLSAWCRMAFSDIWSEDSSPLAHGGKLYLNGTLVEDLEIPRGITSIGRLAFRGCSSLIHVTISRSVERIDDDAFCKCSNLVGFRIENGNRRFMEENGLLLAKDGRVLVVAPCGLEKVSIPENVVEIGRSAFCGCGRLSSVTIPKGVRSIGDCAFHESGLASVTIPDEVEHIGYSAFANCAELADVSIGGNLKEIKGAVFNRCGKLSSVSLPGSVRTVGKYSFQLSGLTSVTIPGSVIGIEPFAFDGCGKLASVTIQDGVKNIGASAFRYNGQIKSIAIPNSVTNIAEEAFAYCWSLESVTVPEGLTSIHETAFLGCGKLLDANGQPRLTRVPGTATRK